jgi:hypothetical protein
MAIAQKATSCVSFPATHEHHHDPHYGAASSTATIAVTGSGSLVWTTASVMTPVIVPGLAANKIICEISHRPYEEISHRPYEELDGFETFRTSERACLLPNGTIRLPLNVVA